MEANHDTRFTHKDFTSLCVGFSGLSAVFHDECPAKFKKQKNFRQLNDEILNTNFARKPIKTHQFTAVCKKIIKGQRRVIKKANYIMSLFPKRFISPLGYIDLANNCGEFKKNRGYILRALSKNEEEFPIAFDINIYKDIEQFERLLRAIYRPQNHYCIHVDKKSPRTFHRAVEKISSCFSNVFVASQMIEVTWGEFSVLQSTLLCMKDLWERSNTWKYFINLSGQEFPMKTNNELVAILQRLKGKSIVRGQRPKESKIRRRFLYVYHAGKRTEMLKEPFRQNFTFYKGSTYVVLSRAFVDFILHDKLARDFLEWVKDTRIPDETYYPTLYRNLDFDKSE
ncbi:beta-1,3-galactosyl-O-glycosyl-glyco beta-1,6-N-acetylglucosaminyltransferase-like isoform X2 [Paramuricea clavata]|uniref:Beta-1,3-galactosyl-O-glycosyl-glyco beta-1,6-N-acetylglucosaminyltransferase-like isoform X2 n=1 Tax=Paramuricea clavata TaxID=317549 RepID=A0A6S7GF58_PARCT|nr:beta-1,3-galactosyl-O-glycosyl-glyco beta-1,6-N-acetylglucosaminyltransferase-like isoform X2 [Paramuricea clavata]